MSAEPGKARNWLKDLFASVVVFLVALPLCIGIAQACGLPPEAGIVTGIVGGLLVGTFAGSPLQVSGPAAGLIVLVIQFLDTAKTTHLKPGLSDKDALLAAIPLLGLAIVLAGGLQILAGLFRLGQWFRAVSPAVVEGMLAGIGITIIAKQFHVMVDDDPPKGIVDGLLTIPRAIWKGIADVPPEFPDALGAMVGGTGPTFSQRLIPNHEEAAIIGLMAILVLAGWKLLKPKAFKFIPSAVVAVIVAVVVNEFGRPVFEALGLPVGPAVDNHGGLGVKRVAVSSNLLDSLVLLPQHWPGWDILMSGFIWKAAFTFALIASAETLLCATAVDTMHTGPRTKYDKELMSQGVGNLVCGMVGALPMTGVIVRSSANVDAGAKTRLSTILHGLWLLLFVMLLPGILSLIPAAALAAVLVYTGWRLVNPWGIRHLWKESRGEAMIFIITAVTVVAEDLLAGVVTGIVLSAAKLLWMFSHMKVRREDEPKENRVHVHLEGAGTFLRLPLLAETLDKLPPKSKVHVHLHRLRFVDHAILTLLSTFRKQYEAGGGQVFLDWEELKSRFDTPRVSSKPDMIFATPGSPEREAMADTEHEESIQFKK